MKTIPSRMISRLVSASVAILAMSAFVTFRLVNMIPKENIFFESNLTALHDQSRQSDNDYEHETDFVDASYNRDASPKTIEPYNNKTDDRIHFSPVQSSPKKALVIMMGGLRGGEVTWNTTFRNLVDLNDADIALLMQDNVPDIYRNSSLLSRAKYVWYVPTFKDWADAIDLIHNSSAWRKPVFSMMSSSNKNIMLGGIKGPLPAPKRGSAAVIFIFRWYVSQRILEHDLVNKYERFVVTRPDQYYLCPHDFRRLEKGYIYVPLGQDFQGICDRHVICGAEHILKVLDVLPPLLSHPEKYQHLLNSTALYNSEMFLKHRWEEEGLLPLVRRYKRNMFIAATPYDHSGWRNASNSAPDLGVLVKYPPEYKMAIGTCKKKNN